MIIDFIRRVTPGPAKDKRVNPSPPSGSSNARTKHNETTRRNGQIAQEHARAVHQLKPDGRDHKIYTGTGDEKPIGPETSKGAQWDFET